MTFNLAQFPPIDFSQEANALLPASAAMASVSLIAYLFFRKLWKGKQAKLNLQSQGETE